MQAKRWQTALDASYAHYPAAKGRTLVPYRCKQLVGLTRGDAIGLYLKPSQPKVFAALTIQVSKVAPATDAFAALQAVAKINACVSKSSQLLMVWDHHLLELQVPCRAGQLLHYEFGDFIAMAQAHLGEKGRPARALVTHCGQMEWEALPLAALVKSASKTRNLWGKNFPQRRREVRKQSKVV